MEERVGFEKVFQIVGGNGIFQWRLLLLLGLQLTFLTWNHMGYIFIGAVPKHSCTIDQFSATNWSAGEIKELALPKQENNEQQKYNSCSYYDLDFNYIESKFKNNYNGALQYVQTKANKTAKACNRWTYDDEIYSSTIVSEYNLVCNRRYLAATIQSTYMIGGFVGTLIFGILNDRVLGRRNSALISIILVLFSGFTSSLSQSYWLFVFIRLFTAMGTSGCMQASSLLCVEHCDIESRAKFYSIVGVFFGVGYAIMPIYAYFIRDWSMLQFAFSSTTLILLSYFWLLPESPRWLASMGRDDEAIEALLKIAKINRKPTPDKNLLLNYIQLCHPKTNENNDSRILHKLGEIFSNFKSLVDSREKLARCGIIWFLFIVVSFVYYGFAFSTNLTSNPYLLVTLGGLMEIPACILPVPFLSMWGRRPTTVICYFLTGIFALAIAITPSHYETLRVIFTMGGKFFVAASFNVIYLVVVEAFPTVNRGIGQSSGTLMGRIGSISAPYVDLLTEVYPDLPCAIFGVVSILGATVALFITEMKGKDLIDQPSELDKI